MGFWRGAGGVGGSGSGSGGGHRVAVAACGAYSFCSISLTLANKAIFSEAELNYPWMLLLVQSVVVALTLQAYFAWRGARALDARLFRQMLLPCAFFTLFIFSNARALRTVSLPILTVVKSLAPLGIALGERLVFRDRIAAGTYAAMALIVAGNAVAAAHDGEFHAAGYLWAVFNIAMNVAYVISLRLCLSDEFSSVQKTLHSNVLACAFIAPLALVSGEVPSFFEEFVLTSMRFRVLFLFSCFLATGIGASVFWVVQTASGSTLSFVGATNKVVVVILGAIFFDAKVTPSGWVGVGLGIFAGGCFAISKKLSAKDANGVKPALRREFSKEDVILFDAKLEKEKPGLRS